MGIRTKRTIDQSLAPQVQARILAGAGVHVDRLSSLAIKLIALARMPFGVEWPIVVSLLRLSAWCCGAAADLALGTAPDLQPVVMTSPVVEAFITSPAEQYRQMGDELVAEVTRLERFLRRCERAA